VSPNARRDRRAPRGVPAGLPTIRKTRLAIGNSQTATEASSREHQVIQRRGGCRSPYDGPAPLFDIGSLILNVAPP
jgi:hypothetical protein